MPAGPIGSVWGTGTWTDVSWEANTWANSSPPVPTPTPSGGIVAGIVAVLAEDVIYSLPPNVVNISVLTTAGTIEVSLDGITWEAMTLDSNNNFTTSAVLIRSTGGDSTVIAKAFQS